MENSVVFILSRDEVLRRDLKRLLHMNGFQVSDFSEEATLAEAIRDFTPALLILGPSCGGLEDEVELAQEIRHEYRRTPIILITFTSSEERAITALRAGVYDYFKCPVSVETVVDAAKRCRRESSLRNIPKSKEMVATSLIDRDLMIGDSLAMQEIKEYIGKVASTDCNVLITGETGTGKELAAELIHRSSPRYQKPFVCINCAALPDSLLESELFGYDKGAFTGAESAYAGRLRLAEGGTVFFDEIGSISPCFQAKILRTIESKEIQPLKARTSNPVDIRVVAATNCDIDRLTSQGSFRTDLYFRLSVAKICMPPLRERKEDIPALCLHFIREFNGRFGREVEGFSEDSANCLFRYDWPGNVRELRNLLEATFVELSSRRISFDDLPKHFRQRLGEIPVTAPGERENLMAALLATNWNKSRAAQNLHWSRMTVYRKIAEYHITPRSPTRTRA